MVKIFTIHGTNDAAESDYGPEWWQLDSEFQTKLASKIEEPLEFVPFHWSGDNSEVDRREAGAVFNGVLGDEDDKVIVMGHSHGGSVALHGLLLRFLKEGDAVAERLRALITVGTPMIRYRSMRNPMFRFNITGQLFLIYAAFVGILAATALFLDSVVYDLSDVIGESLLAGAVDLDDSFWGRVGQLITPAILLASALPIVVLTWFAKRAGRRNIAFRENALYEPLKSVYAPLNHSLDEAIGALSNSVNLELGIIDRKTVKTAILAPIALILAGTLVVQKTSETVNIEALTAPLLALGDNEPTDGLVGTSDDDLAATEPLALRDVMLSLRQLSGDLRDSVDARDALQGGLVRHTAFLRSDYVVIDVGAMMAAPDQWALIDLLEGAGPTAPVSLTHGTEDVCGYFALYLTEDARNDLVLTAFGLPPEVFFEDAPAQMALPRIGGLGDRAYRLGEREFDSPLDRFLTRGVPDGLSCPVAAPPPNAQPGAGAVDALLSGESLISLSDRAMISVRPPTDLMHGDLMTRMLDGERVYPALSRGAALVFERTAFNDIQATCVANETAELVGNFLPGERENTNYLMEARQGLCDQLEGRTFNFYDRAVFFLGQSERGLASAVEFGFQGLGNLMGMEFVDSDKATEGLLDDVRIRTGILAPFYFVGSILILAWLVSWLLALILAPMLSGVFDGTVRKSIFGNDGYGEIVVDVAPGLNFDETQIGTLPSEVEDKITSHVEQYATETIRRVRQLISLRAESQAKGAMPITDIGETLTWQELIHTAYFDVDSFIEHVADVLVDTAGLTRRTPS